MKGFVLRTFPLILLLCLSTTFVALAETAAADEVEIQITQLEENLYMLAGSGGNIAVVSGADGVFVVDDDVTPAAPALMSAISSLSKQPVTMVFNTHWHMDHTGGNEYFADAGALIVAHDNVRARMSSKQYSSFFDSETAPSAAAALPVITFDTTTTIHINGMTIAATHVDAAHTDGDAIVFFREANVVHTGDVFSNGRYPLVDISSGGSALGIIAAVDQLLPLLDAETRIIPGHGPLATKQDLEAYRSMLVLVCARIQALIDEGKTREQALALRPTTNFDAVWGWDLLPGDVWAGVIYDSLAADGPAEAD